MNRHCALTGQIVDLQVQDGEMLMAADARSIGRWP
jgi:hypothetical protein